MFKLKTLLGAFICGVLALGTGIGLNVAGNETLGSAKAAEGDLVLTKTWDLMSENADWSKSNTVLYFSKPYGIKSSSNFMLSTSIEDFVNFNHYIYDGEIKIGFKGLNNGTSITEFEVALVDKLGESIEVSEPISFVNTSDINQTAYSYVTIPFVEGADAIKLYVKNWGKNVLITEASYEITYREVVVPSDPTEINLSCVENTFYENKLYQIEATVLPEGALQSVNWSILAEPENCAEIDANGLLKTNLPGFAIVSATSTVNPSVSKDFEINILKDNILELNYSGIPVVQLVGSSFNYEGLTFIATYESGTQNVDGSLITFNPTIINIDTTYVTATYDEKSVNIPVNVTNATKILFGEHDDFNGWDTSYSQRILSYDDITFKWDKASKQSVTITNMPVTKNATLTITSINKPIKSIELGFAQWTDKTQKVVANVNDSNVATLNFPNEGTKLIVNIDTASIKSLTVSTSMSNQIGWEYAIVEYYDVDPNVVAIEEFIKKYLHPEIATDNNADTGACLEYYAKAKEAFNNLTPEQRRMFIEDVLFAAMYARLSAWARANHETFDASTNMLVSANINSNNIISDEGYLTVIIAVSMLAVSLIAIFAFTKKKAIHR